MGGPEHGRVDGGQGCCQCVGIGCRRAESEGQEMSAGPAQPSQPQRGRVDLGVGVDGAVEQDLHRRRVQPVGFGGAARLVRHGHQPAGDGVDLADGAGDDVVQRRPGPEGETGGRPSGHRPGPTGEAGQTGGAHAPGEGRTPWCRECVVDRRGGIGAPIDGPIDGAVDPTAHEGRHGVVGAMVGEGRAGATGGASTRDHRPEDGDQVVDGCAIVVAVGTCRTHRDQATGAGPFAGERRRARRCRPSIGTSTRVGP